MTIKIGGCNAPDFVLGYDMNDLVSGYKNLLSSFKISDDTIDNLWYHLFVLYNESHRHYHNLSHIQAMMDNFNTIQDKIIHHDVLTFAIFYHDCIYHCQQQSVSNERQSADYFVDNFKNYLPNDLLQKVQIFILATQKHTLLSDDKDLAYFLDLDLLILGQDWEIYRLYCANIAKEYAHINPILYKIGRAKILRQFLKRPRIYYSEYFYQSYEKLARANIKREIKELLF